MQRQIRAAVAVAAGCALALVPTGVAAAARTGECGAGHRASAWDAQWLMSGIQGDRFEVTGGQMAQGRAASPQAKALGARLAADHAKSLRDALSAARRFGIDVPKTPSPSEEWELGTVGALSGTAFDRSYASLEVQDHIQDIQEAKDELSDGCNAAVRSLAHDDLAVLRRHLALARQLKAAGG